MKHVICHYHIFKNSGTSFDELLKENYKDKHCNFDGPYRFSKINQDELAKIIHNTGNLSFSSHQINLPTPTSLDFIVEAVVFIRHPILRLRSIYNFSKKSPKTIAGGELSATLSFKEWVDSTRKDGALIAMLSNAQTRALSGVYGRLGVHRKNRHGAFEFDLNQTIKNLDQVKLLGRTEFFNQDVPRFEAYLNSVGLEFTYRDLKPRNITSNDLSQSFESRLENIRLELGDELFNLLNKYNHQDLELFQYATDRLS